MVSDIFQYMGRKQGIKTLKYLVHCAIADYLLYRCLFLWLVQRSGAARCRWCWKFLLCASDRRNQTIKRYFRFYCSHEKYPLIVRLCLSRNSVSGTTSSSSSQLCTALHTPGIVQILWGVSRIPNNNYWNPVIWFPKQKQKTVLKMNPQCQNPVWKQRGRQFCWSNSQWIE